MELGQLVDYCITYNRQQEETKVEEEKPKKRKATQAAWDAFYGGS